MLVPLLILTLAAAVQAGPYGHRGGAAAAAPAGPAQPRSIGRTFISPMGEPFRVGGSGDEGLAAWFQQADRNHDGSVTLDELKQDAQRFFLTLDTNKDGEIDPDELTNYETVVAPEIRSGMSWGGFTGDELNDEATGGGRLGLLTIPEPVAAADSNFNRGVSAAEFEQAATSRFALLDTDHDGRLTLPELQARRAAIKSNARKPRPRKPVSDEGPPPDSQ
jgi:Ca2+-binding EF-hand superfamily protein